MKRALALVAIFSSLSSPAVVMTQQPSAPQVPSPSFSQPPSVDTQGIKNYLLGPGDVLDVRVLFQSDLNAVVEVDSDGNISSLPFLEAPIPAKCRNEKEVQKDIAKSFSKYLKNPQVSVHISDKKSRSPATITGAVRQPTRAVMQRTVRLNELIATAEGFSERASGTIEILHTEPVMCPQPGQEALAKPFDEDKAPRELIKISDLRAGIPQANPVIRPGDYVTVIEAEPIYVTGSVLAPQVVYLTDNLMLTRALAIAGGTTREAKTTDVQIYRLKPGAPAPEVIRVDYAAIRKNLKPDVALQAFDQIEVPEAGLISKRRLGTTLMSLVTGSVPTLISGGMSRGATTRTTIIR
jgi:polysaccharide export outer membrane protein